jgi:hypothetical protein
MISRRIKISLGALAFATFAVGAFALGQISLNFYVPETVDPNAVVTFTNTNTQTVSGSDLTVPAVDFPAMKGVELHSAIPGALPGSIRDITSFTMRFNYFDPMADAPGIVNVQSFGATTNNLTFTPWIVTGGLVDFEQGTYMFTFTKDVMSAPVNDFFVPGPAFPHGSQSFATATVTGDNLDLAAFDAQNSATPVLVMPGTEGGLDRINPNAVVATPEFGSVFSLGGLLAAGCAAVWVRRRRAN